MSLTTFLETFACKMTAETVEKAYSHVIRTVKLHPMFIHVKEGGDNVDDITQIPIVIGDKEYYIKEVLDILCEERVDWIPDDMPKVNSSLIQASYPGFPLVCPEGKVCYDNNSVYTSNGANYYLSCYLMPAFDGENIPDHLLMLVAAKAMAIHYEEACDIERTTRYEALFASLVNVYNDSKATIAPASHTEGLKINAYQL